MTENNNYVDANVITWTWQYSLHSNSHYPGEPGLDSFIGAKNDGSGGDNWSYMTCKTPVTTKEPAPNFYMAVLMYMMTALTHHFTDSVICSVGQSY